MEDGNNSDASVLSEDRKKKQTEEQQETKPILTLEEELEKEKEKASENYDQMLRLQAEIENIRKRTLKDIENASRGSIERVIMELLPVLDSFDLGLSLKTETIEQYKIFKEGQVATLKLITSLLEKLSIEIIDPVEMKYDPELHEVISLQEDGSIEPGYIIQVVQKGYRLRDRLLRPARVIVSAAEQEDKSST
jgi:molecular chaperone GrpE